MGRKSTVQLLQEALANGDLEKAKELSLKLKPEKENKIVVVTQESNEEQEVQIERPVSKKRISAKKETRIKKSGTGDKICRVESMDNRNRVIKFVDSGEAKNESVKTKPNLGVAVSARTRPPAEKVEIECDKCGNWFEISESLVTDHWKCSRCCRR